MRIFKPEIIRFEIASIIASLAVASFYFIWVLLLKSYAFFHGVCVFLLIIGLVLLVKALGLAQKKSEKILAAVALILHVATWLLLFAWGISYGMP